MSIITAEHGEILKMFLEHPKGFLVCYLSTKSNLGVTLGKRWFFVPNVESNQSQSVSTSVCEDLKTMNIILSSIGDNEFCAQFAVGSMRYRVYIFSDDAKKVFNIEFLNCLRNTPIVWCEEML